MDGQTDIELKAVLVIGFCFTLWIRIPKNIFTSKLPGECHTHFIRFRFFFLKVNLMYTYSITYIRRDDHSNLVIQFLLKIDLFIFLKRGKFSFLNKRFKFSLKAYQSTYLQMIDVVVTFLKCF